MHGTKRDMFDTMTMTKAVGAFCGAFLILLMGKWVGETIYHVGGGGHGDHHAQAYTIDTGSDDHSDAEPEPEVDFSVVLASADVGAGEKLFRGCQACHKLEAGANGTGPYLYGVVGRDVSAAEGYAYSGKLIAVNDVWTPEELSAFLENPKSYAPGTKMAYRGMPDVEDRANLIAWLDTLDD